MSFMDWLVRPSIRRVVANELYEAERGRLNAMALLDLAQQRVVEAKAAVVTAKAHLAYCDARVQGLQGEKLRLEQNLPIHAMPTIELDSVTDVNPRQLAHNLESNNG